MVTIKKFGVLSVGIISGIISAIFGLIAGFWMAGWMSMFSSMMDYMPGADFGRMGWMFSGVAVVLFPIFYGVFGFIGGIITAALYNLFAKWVGGIQVELTSPKAAAGPPVQ